MRGFARFERENLPAEVSRRGDGLGRFEDVFPREDGLGAEGRLRHVWMIGRRRVAGEPYAGEPETMGAPEEAADVEGGTQILRAEGEGHGGSGRGVGIRLRAGVCGGGPLSGAFQGYAQSVEFGSGDFIHHLGAVPSEVVEFPIRTRVGFCHKASKAREGFRGAEALVHGLLRSAERRKKCGDGFGTSGGQRRHSRCGPEGTGRPIFVGKKMVSRPGLEPGTRALKVRCSTN